jgi:GT2 family glycosyltransferase
LGQEVEVIVVDDGSLDGSAEWLDEMAQTQSWLRVVHNASNLGFVNAVNRAADAARGDLLVLLNNDTILLPGWLTALQQTFRQYRDAGAVGGKLVFPDGRLQEAGGIVFDDGTAAKFGYGDVDIGAPLYNFVRQVDYCSGALLATPRALFNEIGGLDTRYAPAYYEDTDYCFQVREQGLAVYYQPQCTVIHLEGATAGHQVTHGAKRYQLFNHERFVERWQATLKDQPERPGEPFDVPTMHRLATRVPQRAMGA